MNKEIVTQFFAPENFQEAKEISTALSKSTMIPKEYQNNPPNVLVALEMANRLGSSVLAVMQSLNVIHGKPSWSATYIIASINTSGRFTPLDFRMTGQGDTRACVAWAKDKQGAVKEGPEVSIEMAKVEGWFSKNGSKWQTMPELMLRYRAASFFGKLYTPDLMMGMQTTEEFHDIYDARKTGDNEYAVNDAGTLSDVNEAFNGDAKKPITDPFGEIYDQKKHATNADGEPVYNTDGSFRKRRATKATASVKEKTSNGTPPADEIISQLKAAKDRDELDLAADLINELDSSEKESAMVIYLQLSEKFEGAR